MRKTILCCFVCALFALGWTGSVSAECRLCENGRGDETGDWYHRLPDYGSTNGCGLPGTGSCHNQWSSSRCWDNGLHPICRWVDNLGEEGLDDLIRRSFAAAEAGDDESISRMTSRSAGIVGVDPVTRAISVTACDGRMLALAAITNDGF